MPALQGNELSEGSNWHEEESCGERDFPYIGFDHCQKPYKINAQSYFTSVYQLLIALY